MTELAIAALSGAGVTVAVVVGMLVLSLKLSAAQSKCEVLAGDNATMVETNKAKDAALATMTADLKTAKERADAIDAQYQKLLAAVPVSGAYGVLSAEAAAAHPTAGGSGVAVPDGAPAANAGPNDLLKPGE